MFNDERVAHYVKRNEQTRMPRRHIFLHSVSQSRRVKGGTVKTWYAACATFRHAVKGRTPVEATQMYRKPSDLWAAVGGFCRAGARTVLWSHNLGTHVRITDALHYLPRMGWSLTGHNLAASGTWLVWHRDGMSLTMADSASVFPKLLHQVGGLFGISAPRASLASDTDKRLDAQAIAGNAIVRTAVKAYLQWIEESDMGNWQMTGSGQAYATFRHRFLTHKMLVHDNTDALAMERRAMWTGRCEAYWHGTLTRQVIDEWDFTSAYASICAETALPIRLVGPMPPRYPWRSVLGSDAVGLLAQCTINTDVPVVPTSHEGRILWPVGTFETTLWDVEIAEAIKAGAEVTVHSGFLYRKAPAMAAWGDWILRSLCASDEDVPAWQKIVIRHHSTATIGRMAMMYPEWETFGTSGLSGVDRRRVVDADTGETTEMMQVGTTVWMRGAVVESGQSQPAITSYVMACARVKLWRVMQWLPVEATLYVDTDSILVTDRWRHTMEELSALEVGRGLRLKKSWDGFSIYGPRQIITGQKVRVAGVPSAARRIDRDLFAGEVWESLPVSMTNRRAHSVVTRDRQWRSQCVDRRRTGPSLGWTKPIHIGA